MCSTGRSRWFAAVGFPIRISPDRRLYTAPRGFSQCPTSFIGIWHQGIHREPFVASLRDVETSFFFFLLFVCLHSIQFVIEAITLLSLLRSTFCLGG